ncbi:unnamed protein product [Nezara viridula]|uniref:Uncharacterized protein n=1 Tax=Nezara viridula TaxID=85310 RepID=A0A9P0HPK6_NEZVI|nr:unnamed protein product [Nezara viridula]
MWKRSEQMEIQWCNIRVKPFLLTIPCHDRIVHNEGLHTQFVLGSALQNEQCW